MKIYIKSVCLSLLLAISVSALFSCDSSVECTHEWSDWVVVKEATCGESGYSNRQCNKCEEVDRSIQYTLPHSFSTEWKYDGSYHWHVATCLHKNEISDKTAHSYVGNTCSVCGALRATQGLDYAGNLGERTYRVVGLGNTLDDNIVVARYFNGCEIVAVAEEAFTGAKGLKSVVLQQYITSIGEGAFKNCADLTTVQFSNAVTEIPSELFAGCTSLTKIVFVGTKTEWNNLAKGDDWDKDTGNYTVYFSDGTSMKKQ